MSCLMSLREAIRSALFLSIRHLAPRSRSRPDRTRASTASEISCGTKQTRFFGAHRCQSMELGLSVASSFSHSCMKTPIIAGTSPTTSYISLSQPVCNNDLQSTDAARFTPTEPRTRHPTHLLIAEVALHKPDSCDTNGCIC